MNTNFYKALKLKNTSELLEIYTNKRGDYQEEYLQTIEKILEERNETFLKK